ncbi:hypothetical protein JAAARDRAFT_196683 [Jaapia argillacea MUCL 33604]|uniref:Uncharacterized protein n=1 Tax=Jaapia argillacea MUCL 33604 TaxID=933084 RepID=A0A067PHP3_9AGAM|nr:hypothetical protein JAAARDRAFT_196683 [Jaapia argillacea MUCL 33604]
MSWTHHTYPSHSAYEASSSHAFNPPVSSYSAVYGAMADQRAGPFPVQPHADASIPYMVQSQDYGALAFPEVAQGHSYYGQQYEAGAQAPAPYSSDVTTPHSVSVPQAPQYTSGPGYIAMPPEYIPPTFRGKVQVPPSDSGAHSRHDRNDESILPFHIDGSDVVFDPKPLDGDLGRITFWSAGANRPGISLQSIEDSRFVLKGANDVVLASRHFPLTTRWQCPGYRHAPFTRGIRVEGRKTMTRVAVLHQVARMVLNFFAILNELNAQIRIGHEQWDVRRLRTARLLIVGLVRAGTGSEWHLEVQLV